MKKILLLAVALGVSASVSAQVKTDKTMKPMSNMGVTSSMKTPMLKYSTMANMNMMMSGHNVDISPAPGYKILSHRVRGHTATLTYASNNAKGLFDLYNTALVGESWKEDMGMKMGMVKSGEYAEAYVMKNWKLDLMTQTRGSRTVVTIKTH